jgi:hypothetical protein
MILANLSMCRVPSYSHQVVVTETYPTEFVSAFEACHIVSTLLLCKEQPSEHTRHVVATIILFNVIDAVAPGTLLGELADR